MSPAQLTFAGSPSKLAELALSLASAERGSTYDGAASLYLGRGMWIKYQKITP